MYKKIILTAEKGKQSILLHYLIVVFVSIFILYPLLHELGHALAAWMFGGTVVRITIFPAFYTECFIRPEQLGCYIMTAMAGILLPLICSIAVHTRNDRGFLVAFCLRVMSVGYSAGELVCVSKCILGSATETSDLSVLIYETNIDPYVSLVLAGLLLILSLILLATMEPLICLYSAGSLNSASPIQRVSPLQNIS